MVRAILSLVQHFRCHVHTVCVKVPHSNLADDRVLIAHACLISHHSDSEAVAKLPKAFNKGDLELKLQLLTIRTVKPMQENVNPASRILPCWATSHRTYRLRR